jgi:hypothetical protein
MKQIKTYHIESYWQTEAAKRQKRAKLEDKLFDIIAIGVAIALESFIVWEFCRQLFEII